LNPTRIVLDTEGPDCLRIWDLWGFTSNHHESRHFINALAKFCEGHEITIIDDQEGCVQVDLGMYLWTYAQLNTFPEYSLERLDEYYQDLVSFHNIAGFLGVFGNLTFSTFLHGASVLQVIGDPSKLNVAGDDGHCATVPGTLRDSFLTRIIRRNGVLNEEKEFFTEEIPAVCLKRSVVQIHNRVIQQPVIIWPSISLILMRLLGDGRPNIHHEFNMTREELLSSLASEMMRFLRSLHIHSNLKLEGLSFVVSFLQRIYHSTGLPLEGSVPQLGGYFLCPMCPDEPYDLTHDPLERVLAYHYRGFVELPLRQDIEQFAEERDVVWSVGAEWYDRSCPKWNYLSVLGYVQTEPVKVTYVGLEGYRLLQKEFLSHDREVVRVTCIGVPPRKFQILP